MCLITPQCIYTSKTCWKQFVDVQNEHQEGEEKQFYVTLSIDGDCCQTMQHVNGFFVLLWPPQSTDLKLIKHFWDLKLHILGVQFQQLNDFFCFSTITIKNFRFWGKPLSHRCREKCLSKCFWICCEKQKSNKESNLVLGRYQVKKKKSVNKIK